MKAGKSRYLCLTLTRMDIALLMASRERAEVDGRKKSIARGEGPVENVDVFNQR